MSDQERETGIESRLARPWVESPFFEELLADSDFGSEDRERARFFNRNGFLVLPDLIPEKTVDRARREVKPLLAPSVTDPRRTEGRFHNAWRDSPAVREIACNPTVLDLLAKLYGREPIPFQTLSFEVGTEQRAHADTIHFHSLPPRFMCGVWVALEDVGPENGSIVYYPGSHRLPSYSFDDLGLRLINRNRPGPLDTYTYQDYDLYEDFVEALMRVHDLEAANLEIEKGSVLIWAAGLVHGGGKILEQGRTRWSQVTHFFFEDCIFYQPILSSQLAGDLYLHEVTNIRTGKVVPSSYRGMELPEAAVQEAFKLMLDAEGGADVLRAISNFELKRMQEIEARPEQRAEDLEAAVAEARQALEAVVSSRSYRLGRALTAPFRKLLGR